MYVTVDEANDYFAVSLSGWDSLDTAEKEAALVSATRAIDRQAFVGKQRNTDHQFPREGQDEVPQVVKDACCEEALFLFMADRKAIERGVTSVKIGDASETYSDAAIQATNRDRLSPKARSLLRFWLKKSFALRG